MAIEAPYDEYTPETGFFQGESGNFNEEWRR
jgi:hypothetical protein